jgi:hypothetical protein
MNTTDMLMTASWIAVGVLSVSYWFQIWKIHIHKEVRDISITYNLMLAIGFGILGVTAWMERNTLFLVKQIVTTIPTVIIVFQILYHRKDTWHEPGQKNCSSCQVSMEKTWDFCPFCGSYLSEEESA